MGTVYTASCANLFIAQFEENIFTDMKDISLLFLRYIDNAFIIWRGTKDCLVTLLTN